MQGGGFMPEIQIKILSDEEFDSLPDSETRGAFIGDSLGFADTFTKKVFVRDTGLEELNHYLIQHEVEHLFSDDRAHEDEEVEGIRHKKFFKEIFLPIVTGGLVSGGTKGGVFNLGRKENKFSLPNLLFTPFLAEPFGALNREQKAAQERQQQAQQDTFQKQAQFSPFQFTGQTGVSVPSSQRVETPNVVGTLGQGAINTPFGGDVAGGFPPQLRERLKGFFSGRIPF